MTAGIVGLGLIGGSLAKAYHEAGERVLAHDIDRDVLSFAVISGAVDEALTDETMAECDVILLAVRPAAAVEWLKNHAAKIDKHTVVIDCCGTKRKVCAACFPIAEQYGITYLGGHPMAGTQFSGFTYAKAILFVGAPMVRVPPRFDDIELLSHVKDLLSPAGFGSYSVTTAEQHDEMIAFTSQMAHVVSNAYIKSPTAAQHKGFSAGSYKDMTRVAWLAPRMWAELFLENRDFLLKEIDCYIEHLSEYKTAMEHDDEETLIRLLDEGKKRKEEVDGCCEASISRPRASMTCSWSADCATARASIYPRSARRAWRRSWRTRRFSRSTASGRAGRLKRRATAFYQPRLSMFRRQWLP